MKNLVLSLLFCVPVMAQMTSFKSEGETLVWERTFPADNANIVALLEGQPNLKVNSFMDNVYKGTGNEIKNTCDGGSGLTKNDCKFDFIILVNPDHYVVKVKNMKVLEKFGPMQTRTVANRFEKYYMDGSKVKADDRAAADLGCMENFLDSVFSTGITSSGGALTSN
ncbi:MAG: hypothetical protein EOO45_11645 [Flavobacterium sp.]|nr:MAG: hypothetical protein EOO45_11645 [Flavobacterium sp.]